MCHGQDNDVLRRFPGFREGAGGRFFLPRLVRMRPALSGRLTALDQHLLMNWLCAR